MTHQDIAYIRTVFDRGFTEGFFESKEMMGKPQLNLALSIHCHLILIFSSFPLFPLVPPKILGQISEVFLIGSSRKFGITDSNGQ